MAGFVNVNREVDDEFFRYKMPRLIAKVEGKGNGIKTVIVNMTEIAKSLYRQPSYPTKYFGCELGAQTQFDLKNDRYIVNGQHDANKLQDLLDGFIKKFVLCANCSNPETDLQVKSRRNEVHARCKACGHIYTIDPAHRLTTFILRNPPEGTKKSGKGKGSKGGAPGTGGAGGSPERAEEEGDQEEAEVAPVTTEKTNHIDEDDWGEDSDEPLVEAEHLSEAVKNMVMDMELADKTTEERANMFHAFVRKRYEMGQIVGREKELANEADRLEIRDKAVVILLEVLLSEPAKYIEQIKKYRKAFLYFTLENERAQKHLLGGLEKLIGEHQEFFLPRVSKLLHTIYDADILLEDSILEWADKGPSKRHVDRNLSKKIHENAKKVVEWLRTASDDEDEDDDDAEKEEPVKNGSGGNSPNKMVNGTTAPAVVNTNGGAAAELEADSDIDIDDI